MLRIYPISVEVIRQVAPLAERIERFDRDQARQLRRSMKSVAYNLAEGSGARAGRRRNAYDIALGEARETLANLQIAEALGYVPRLDDKVLTQLCALAVRKKRFRSEVVGRVCRAWSQPYRAVGRASFDSWAQ